MLGKQTSKERACSCLPGAFSARHLALLSQAFIILTFPVSFVLFSLIKAEHWGTLRAKTQGPFSFRLKKDKWMNVQVGDIIKLENDHPVTVSISPGHDFSFLTLNPVAFPPPLLATFSCLALHWSHQSSAKKLVLSISHHNSR